MKNILKFYNNVLICLFCCSISFSCMDKWEQNVIDLPEKKTTLSLQMNNKDDGDPLSALKVQVFAQARGDDDYELVVDGATDELGRIMIPDFTVPNKVKVIVKDSRYPVSEMNYKVLNEDAANIYMDINTAWGLANLYDATNWDVIECSSYQKDTGNPTNIFFTGIATWHTQYSPVEYNYPHWIVIDLSADYQIHGFAFKNRPNLNGPIKDYELLLSDDNVNWRSLGERILKLHSDWQLVDLPTIEKSRYVKLIVKSSHLNNKYINLAQFGIY